MDWHIHYSRAFHELLVEPLAPFADVELVAWDGRSRDPLGNCGEHALNEPIIFCQRPPSLELLEIPGARLVWIPMWDNVAQNWSSKEWWASLPKNLRVVAFSSAVERYAREAGLPTLSLRYHKNPVEFSAARWDKGRTLFYWNRTGLFGANFIKKLCAVLNIQDLYFRGTIDPKITPRAYYELPTKIGKTVVHAVSRFDSQAQYFDLMERCNIYLAPRALEGVGLTFLEAMASGCAVIGYDAPTMNEYITQKIDGYLFPAESIAQETKSFLQYMRDTFRTRSAEKSFSYPYRVSQYQEWSQLEQLDLKLLGHRARLEQEAGFALWKSHIAEYAHFILDW